MKIELAQIAAAVQGMIIPPGANVEVSGVSTDTRTLQPGDLFIPLRGENYDGHDYLLQAVEAGAVACLSEEIIAALPVPIVQVKDTLAALGDLAATLRQAFDGPVVAITGSAGKTTTKELLSAILLQVGPGLKTAGNYNNLIGLPLTLFNRQPEHQWMVLEMGTSALGEIARLAEIARPDVGVITNVAEAHLETLHSLEGVARAKGELFAALTAGTAVINADDERVRNLPVANNVRRLLYGLTADAQIRATDIQVRSGCVGFTLAVDSQSATVQLNTPGRHQVHNALAAAAAATALDVPLTKIIQGLQTYKPAAGRMLIRPMVNEGVMLDDSYNANPLSMEAALVALDDLMENGRRIAVLGDMLELGEGAEELHFAIGQKAATHLDYLVVMGQYAQQLQAGAVDAGMAETAIVFADDHTQAAGQVAQWFSSGAGVLLKGSRGMQLEKVADALTTAGLLITDEEA